MGGTLYIDLPIVVNSSDNSIYGIVNFNVNSSTHLYNVTMNDDSKVNLLENSTIFLKKNLIIHNSHAELVLSLGSSILPYNPDMFTVNGLWNNPEIPNPNYDVMLPSLGMVVLDNNSSLTIDNSSKTASVISLISGLYISEGFTVQIKKDSKINLGQFVSKGTFKINRGVDLTLFSDHNYAFNELKFSEESSSLTTAIQSFKGEFPFFSLAKTDKYLYCFSKIFVTESHLTLPNLKFHRGQLEIQSVNFDGILENSQR